MDVRAVREVREKLVAHLCGTRNHLPKTTIGTTSYPTALLALNSILHQDPRLLCLKPSALCIHNRIIEDSNGIHVHENMSRIAVKTLNKHVIAASYAVRGPVVNRSAEIAKALSANPDQFGFNSVVQCNIGNPQALKQKPISFIRDVLSVVVNPDLATRFPFPADVVARADRYLKACSSVGSYSESQGIHSVREDVCKFLERRDGYAADPADIFLTNGASEGVRFCMQTIMREPSEGINDGVLTPIPQYPLYSALITLLNGSFVPYYLDEGKSWSCTTNTLTEALNEAKSKGITTRALVVINPGNPTGQVLPVEAMQAVVSWCKENEICLMADEVYQENIWKPDAKFVSFRKVAKDMNAFDGEKCLQLISFHSISKGFTGECGLRGGYFEVQGIPADVKAQILKLASINLCSGTIGQIATGLMVNPPQMGEESYDSYESEKNAILTSMKRRAVLISEALNQLDGVSCNPIEGAMYAFPTVTLPAGAIEAAAAQGTEPDAMYAMELLENTGIVVVPGSGFGQVPGTFHFRTTILPPEDKMEDVVTLLGKFHANFLKKYGQNHC